MNNGKVIVIEGACDGIGKSTQLGLLKEHLENDGEKVIGHHFPTYESYEGRPVVKYLKGEFGELKNLSPYFVNGLYAMDRWAIWNEKLKKEYEKGSTILLDRYTTSSLIYQSAVFDKLSDKEKFIDYVVDYEYNKLEIKQPDKVIFLVAPFDLVQKMRRDRNVNMTEDIHERDLEYLKKVYDNALFISKYLNWDVVECNNNDVMKTKEEIHDKVYKLTRRG